MMTYPPPRMLRKHSPSRGLDAVAASRFIERIFAAVVDVDVSDELGMMEVVLTPRDGCVDRRIHVSIHPSPRMPEHGCLLAFARMGDRTSPFVRHVLSPAPADDGLSRLSTAIATALRDVGVSLPPPPHPIVDETVSLLSDARLGETVVEEVDGALVVATWAGDDVLSVWFVGDGLDGLLATIVGPEETYEHGMALRNGRIVAGRTFRIGFPEPFRANLRAQVMAVEARMARGSPIPSV